MKSTIAVLIIATAAGCASTEMRQYVGQDIRQVVLDSGPPVNAFDMSDGERVFQWNWGGGTYAAPSVTTNSGTVTRSGNQAWLSSTSITSGGGSFTAAPCIINYLARWDESRKGWIVTSYKAPKALVC